MLSIIKESIKNKRLVKEMTESALAESAEYDRLNASRAKGRFIDRYPGKIEESEGYVVDSDCGPMYLLDGTNWPVPTLYHSSGNVTVFIDKKRAKQAINETKQKAIRHGKIGTEMDVQETNNRVYCFDEDEELFNTIYFNHGYGYNLFVYEKEKNARLWIPEGAAVWMCRESSRSLKERVSPSILLQKVRGVNRMGTWYQH